MKYVDEYRDADTVRRLLDAIRARVTRPWTIMEVCGGQTHALLRYGFDQELAGAVELIHGPGCPVCVTSIERIDRAIELAHRPGVLVATFGDMLRVPGSRTSLSIAKSEGAQVRAVYSPLDAVAIAARQPDTHVVFFAVGFETTVPATALAVRQAEQQGVTNFSLLAAHVRVQPAMESLLDTPDNRVQGFLAAGHVCTVVGFRSYHQMCQKHHVSIVVTGFEPIDLAAGLLACVEQLESGRHEVENRYSRCAQIDGNHQAVQIVDDVYEVCDRAWRGLGVVQQGGLRLRASWSPFDAERRFPDATLPIVDSSLCRSGEVLTGRLKPPQCPEFGRTCTPEHPLGAPMVSNEGACAAYFHYHDPFPRVTTSIAP